MELTYKTYTVEGLGTIRTAMDETYETWIFINDVLKIINVSSPAYIIVRQSSILSSSSKKIIDHNTNRCAWVATATGIQRYVEKRAEYFVRKNTDKELALRNWIDEMIAENTKSKPKYKTIRSLAKDMNIGCRKLYKKLLDDNIVESVDGVLLPTQQTKLSGLMALVTSRDIYDTQYNVSSYVTDKGCKYFKEKYSKAI